MSTVNTFLSVISVWKLSLSFFHLKSLKVSLVDVFYLSSPRIVLQFTPLVHIICCLGCGMDFFWHSNTMCVCMCELIEDLVYSVFRWFWVNCWENYNEVECPHQHIILYYIWGVWEYFACWCGCSLAQPVLAIFFKLHKNV